MSESEFTIKNKKKKKLEIVLYSLKFFLFKGSKGQLVMKDRS